MNRARTLLALVGLAVLLALAGGTLMFMAGHARYGPWGVGMPFGGPYMMGGYDGGAYGPPPPWFYRMERHGAGTYGAGYGCGTMGWGAPMPYGSMGWGRGGGLRYSVYGRLDLTPQQREQLDQLQLGLFQQEAALAAQLYEPDAQLRKMYAARTSDAAALDPVFAKIASIQRQMFQARLAAKTRFEALLTPEQKQRLKELPQEAETPAPW